MKTPLTKITIVTEGLLKDRIVDILREQGATGFTMTRAEGEGTRQVRARDWEGPNMRIETIMGPKSADAVMEKLSDSYFDHYSVIAWLTQVEVLRGEKFLGE